MTLGELFSEIAKAIRSKDGTTGSIPAMTFPERIRALSGGGGGGGPFAKVSVFEGPDGEIVDIPVNIKASVSVTAEEEVVELQKTHALYNGVRLPAMPEDVLANYPYVWIRDNGSTGYYDLMFAKGIWHLYYANALNHNDNYNVELYRIKKTDANATEWVFNQSISSNAWGIDENRVCIWSNHDIPNGPATATDIYFEGTEPVPTD